MTKPITTPTMYHESLLQRYKVTITEIPADLPASHTLTANLDLRSVAMPKTAGAVQLKVDTHDAQNLVAIAVFAADDEVVRCDTVDVMEQYKRQGVATSLYKLASRIFDAPVVPSLPRKELTPEARAFWGSRTQISHKGV